jgi:hypothetical protein
VDGSAVHAVIVIGADVVPDDLAANDHRVDGEPVHPTSQAFRLNTKKPAGPKPGGFFFTSFT